MDNHYPGFLISSFAAIHHPVFQVLSRMLSLEKIKDANANIGVVDSIVGIIAPILLGIMLYQIDKSLLPLLFPYYTCAHL